jgi:hypothetical protein
VKSSKAACRNSIRPFGVSESLLDEVEQRVGIVAFGVAPTAISTT